MKLLTYIENDEQKVGILSDSGDTVIGFSDLGLSFSSMLDFIERHSPADMEMLKSASAKSDYGVPLSRVTSCAPIPNPKRDIICIGQNYVDHAREAAKFSGNEYEKSQYPVYFSKRADEAVPNGGIIPLHSGITSQLDYEGELAVIIGKPCFHASEEDVAEHIFGYTIINDVSARDIQYNHKQFFFGKSLHGTTPMGPYIVTADEIGFPPELSVKTWVNAELRQDGNTKNFIYSIPELIATLSAGIILMPGDILITGTPSGVGMGFSPPRFLSSGDVIECEIEKIGVLKNIVI